MAKFSYFYKTSDGVRHEAEITAPSKDEAFARLRKEGIRPIKVVQHEPPLIIKVFKRSWVVLFVVEKSAAAPFGVAVFYCQENVQRTFVFALQRYFHNDLHIRKKEGEKVCLRKCR